MNSLLALDVEWYDSIKKTIIRNQFFSGHKSSPLLHIFKRNGYITNTLYNGNFFGKIKGPYVDFYHVNLDEGSCRFLEEKKKQKVLLGYCYYKKWKFQKYWGFLGFNTKKIDETQFLLEKMNANLNLQIPQLFVAYIFSPGHTPHSYNHDNSQDLESYKELYSKSSKKTANSLIKLIEFIDKKDPTAILYVFGDHGPWLSRLPHAKVVKNFDTISEFTIQDRHGVYGGIYPVDRCKNIQNLSKESKFATVSYAAIEIINCLTAGELNYKKPLLTLPEKYYGRTVNFNDFIYE